MDKRAEFGQNEQGGLLGALNNTFSNPMFQRGAAMFSAASSGDDIGKGFMIGQQAVNAQEAQKLRRKQILEQIAAQKAAAASREQQLKATSDYRDRSLGLQRQRMDISRDANSLSRQKHQLSMNERKFKSAAGLADMIGGIADPERKNAMFEKLISSDPLIASRVQGMDVDDALSWIKAEAGVGGQDQSEVQQRHHQAIQYGIDPNSPEGRTYILTGKMSMPKAAQGKGDDDLAMNVSGGLDRLASIAATGPDARYTDSEFENSLGAIQGDDDGGWLTGLSRAWGALSFDKTSPTEIRTAVRGDTEALAAAIKPLIRKPGEGPWTDSDQKRLVAVVGDLSLSNDKQQFMRQLEAVRERIRSNFGINLPPIGTTSSEPSPKLPSGWSVRKID
jgi:hypothetical protein